MSAWGVSGCRVFSWRVSGWRVSGELGEFPESVHDGFTAPWIPGESGFLGAVSTTASLHCVSNSSSCLLSLSGIFPWILKCVGQTIIFSRVSSTQFGVMNALEVALCYFIASLSHWATDSKSKSDFYRWPLWANILWRFARGDVPMLPQLVVGTDLGKACGDDFVVRFPNSLLD